LNVGNVGITALQSLNSNELRIASNSSAGDVVCFSLFATPPSFPRAFESSTSESVLMYGKISALKASLDRIFNTVSTIAASTSFEHRSGSFRLQKVIAGLDDHKPVW
jgi:hypothetical protein